MIFLGIGEIVGSLVNGKLHDWLGTRPFVLINLFWMSIGYGLIIWYNQNDSYDFNFAMTLCFFWGIQDAGLTNLWRVLCGFQFEAPAIAYSVQQAVMSFFVFVVIYCGSLVKSQLDYLIFFLVTGIFGASAYILLFFSFDFIKKTG